MMHALCVCVRLDCELVLLANERVVEVEHPAHENYFLGTGKTGQSC